MENYQFFNKLIKFYMLIPFIYDYISCQKHNAYGFTTDNKLVPVMKIQHYKQFRYERKLFRNILPTTGIRYKINDGKNPLTNYSRFFSQCICIIYTFRNVYWSDLLQYTLYTYTHAKQLIQIFPLPKNIMHILYIV